MTASLERIRDSLAGRYRVERELGRGATATVYLAFDSAQERRVALKVLHPDLVEALGGQRFLREIRFAGSLHHPNLVAVHDSGEANGIFYYVAPYMEDGSLRQRLERERQLSIDDGVRITRDVADALQHVHAHGIIHRDIKPENILFAGDHACLADFGIARAVDTIWGDTLLGETITSAGIVVGTPAYMSPEQGSGERAVDARSDQYSLACVLYEMIAGVPPFIGATAQAVIAQRFAHRPLPLSHYRPSVPAHVEAAVDRALALSPADRFPSLTAFSEAISERGSATFTAAHAAAASRVMRRRWFAVGAATVIVALAVFGFRDSLREMSWRLGSAPDTTRFVVLPFDGTGGNGVSGRDVADAFYTALREWEDLDLIEDLAVRDAIGRHRTSITSLGEAAPTAADLGAGRLVWGRVSSSATRTTIRAYLYDVRTRRSIRESSVSVDLEEQLASRVPGLVDELLRLPELRHPIAGELGTRSFRARRSFEKGAVEYANGRFAAAFEQFRDAAALDPQFARAQLRVALVGALTDLRPNDEWKQAARRAVGADTGLSDHDRATAAAVAALADGHYPAACAAFDRARRLDSLDFAAWYGAGECRYLDSAVVRSARSPSGYVFRSSYQTAAQAYLRAAELDARVHALPIYRRLKGALKTETQQTRGGSSDGGSLRYAAFPNIVADTLAFTPYLITRGSIPPGASGDSESHRRAIERSVRLLLGFARSWADRDPGSAHALAALGEMLEVGGTVASSGTRGTSALDAIRRARVLSRDPQLSAELGLRQVRLLLKIGDFAGASRLTDTLLTGPSAGDDELAFRYALAGLTGRVALVEQLGRSTRTDVTAGGAPLPPQLMASAAALEAYSAMGVCTRLGAAREAVLRAVDAYLPAEHAEEAKRELLALPAQWAASCTDGRSAFWLPPRAAGGLPSAQRFFAEGRAAEALTVLDSLDSSRKAIRPGDISLDHTYQESWLRAAAGDTVGAAAKLDRMLGSLPTHRRTLVERMPEAAALPRAMLLRAELAMAGGDPATARHWASAVETLWVNAHPELKGSVDRIRRLASR